MADISHSLFIKYGLPRAPNSTEIDRWVQLTDAYIRQGYEREAAGAMAAKATFYGYNTVIYASEADSIDALLSAARSK
ncbi:hypothetical protein [Pseudoxanthomonas kalamensis]|uniref:hypothetical protein n=1 Tax=Pseudoxanthomonas kalamensis TaxID=289483 RepID=UPI001391BFB2|nr:hypothetical protein [Pseudoxanthomonas kalamensis]